MNPLQCNYRACGEIGIRSGLKIRRGKTHAGSSPARPIRCFEQQGEIRCEDRLKPRSLRCFWGFTRFFTVYCRPLLRRVVRAECAAFCATLSSRPIKVLVTDHVVVRLGNRLGVTHPRGADGCGILRCQLGRAAGTHGIEQARPGLQTGTLDDPQELRPQVHGCVPIA